jgi:hypothetical protein
MTLQSAGREGCLRCLVIMEEKQNKKKFFVYIDESGQDTEGLVFVVSVLVLEKDELPVADILECIERESKKRNVKWNKSKHAHRKNYIEALLEIPYLAVTIFFDTFRDSKEYIELTSLATAKAILKRAGKEDYKASVFVDGLKRKEVEVFSRGLRALYIRTRKVRGIKKDENNVFIRLVDALCGLVRDAYDGNEWADRMLKKLIRKKILTEL